MSVTRPGLQRERTSLAWVRTALGLAGCALLAGRLALVRDSPLAMGAALAAALLSVGVIAWSHDRVRRVRDVRDVAVSALVLVVAIATLGLLALTLIALPA